MHIHKTLKQKTEECLALLRSTKRDNNPHNPRNVF